jgi:hypothetical protein
MEEQNCNLCRYSSLGVIEGGEEDNEPVLKCMRYPPTVVWVESGMAQLNPEAVAVCGEYWPVAENTGRVIGTTRKVKDYATRIPHRAIGYLRSVRDRHRHLQDGGSPDHVPNQDGP